MKLFRLIEGIEIIRSKVNFDIDIEDISSDSRRVRSGGIFIALKGTKRNGNDYIEMALKSGCSCIITDDENVYYEYEKTVYFKFSGGDSAAGYSGTCGNGRGICTGQPAYCGRYLWRGPFLVSGRLYPDHHR